MYKLHSNNAEIFIFIFNISYNKDNNCIKMFHQNL